MPLELSKAPSTFMRIMNALQPCIEKIRKRDQEEIKTLVIFTTGLYRPEKEENEKEGIDLVHRNESNPTDKNVIFPVRERARR